MFGYVMVDHKQMNKEEKERYQSLYCGLCNRLCELHGSAGRMTLTYDMVFLSQLLCSLYKEQETTESSRCLVHPLSTHEYTYSKSTDYVADMSIVLAYFKNLDDWNDDSNLLAKANCKALQKKAVDASVRWPRQYIAIASGISELNKMEKNNETNPDLPANCFAKIMGELFVRKRDEHEALLRMTGEALGRFIYMIDAVNDLKDDIRKERYNPLVSVMNTNFDPMLDLLIGECTRAFNTLPLDRDLGIMKNTLYSGVWMKYKSKERGSKA